MTTLFDDLLEDFLSTSRDTRIENALTAMGEAIDSGDSAAYTRALAEFNEATQEPKMFIDSRGSSK